MTDPTVLGEQALVPGAPTQGADDPQRRSPAIALALGLLQDISPVGTTAFLALSERRADEIARALAGLSRPDEVQVLVLPPWDSLPFDPGGPSRDSMGRRLAVLAALAQAPDRPRIVITSPAAVVLKIPGPPLYAASLEIAVGAQVDRPALNDRLLALGYFADDRIDEVGEFALMGEVIDLFPAAAPRPVRIDVDAEGSVTAIRPFDPVTQLSDGGIDSVTLGAVAEPDALATVSDVEPIERGSVFALFEGARLLQEIGATEACERIVEHVEEAWRSTLAFGEGPRPCAPADLYLTRAEVLDGMRGAPGLDVGNATEPPRFAAETRRGAAIAAYVAAQREAGRRVILAGLAHEQRAMLRACRRQLTESPVPAADWREVEAAAPGALLTLTADLDGGLKAEARGIVVLTPVEILGARIAQTAGAPSWLEEPELRLGDVVLHEDHGLGILQGLEQIETNGALRDVVRIAYRDDDHVLAPVEDLPRIWRYGSDAAGVSLDRLRSDSWLQRKLEISAEVEQAARVLVQRGEARMNTSAPRISPPRAEFVRLAAQFPYPESVDQAAAIDAVLADLKAGIPMNRLVCGDVGFGKTEVALRAAGAVALAGHQVLVAAPTTVLARQHYETFKRRFEGTGVEVAHLSRLVDRADADRVRAGLADGTVGIVIGTQALAADDIAFADLALVVIDEEHRFGAELKAGLSARAPHLLSLTATPIPRTLQGALVGIQDVSVIASPPARRLPIRTFTNVFDGGAVRTALLREKARQGQSFFVTPQIADMPLLRQRLAELVPELTVLEAHGKMSPETVERAMVAFAQGQGDILLATNIIENGLDVPRANTIFIHRPDRFGLAQLHQLRGRVGRGRRQGVSYLVSEPGDEVGEAAEARLATLEAFGRLGSGFAISARDLDLRGGGDLVGDEQAGHVRLVGASLYQALIQRAVRKARGEEDILPPPQLDTEHGHLPEAYIPDPALRINLYNRLFRADTAEAVDGLGGELEDRFGAPPEPALSLLAHARLTVLARGAGVTRIVAGPKATAFSILHACLSLAQARVPDDGPMRWSKDRLIMEVVDGGSHDAAAIEGVLERLSG